jgi:glycosyltransferase involved in cell wall biosynthesis
MIGENIVAILPAFNEQKTIAEVILKTKKYVDRVIVVDDGSSDLTAEIAERLKVTVIRHKRNMGYGAALRSGLEYAMKLNPAVVVILDADGQHDPKDIPRLIEPILRGEAAIVIGSRFIDKLKEKIPAYRKFGIRMITKLMKVLTYNNLTDAQSGFRAYNRKAIEKIQPSESGMGASIEILFKAKEHNLKVVEVPIEIRYGENSPTQNPIYHGLNVLLSIIKYVSIRRPSLFYRVSGTILLLIALIFLIQTLHIFIATQQITTNIVPIAMVAIIVGLMLLIIAIIIWVLTIVVKEYL